MQSELLRWAADCGLRVADRAGVLERFRSPSCPRPLMYHGILRRKPSGIGLQAVDREEFVRQMRYLKQHFRIVHPRDFENEPQAASAIRKSAVILTFDDGFANNGTIAMPILEDLQIPAVFFITTRHLARDRYLWFIHARALFRLWPARRVELLGRTWDLGLTPARERSYWEFMKAARTSPTDQVYRDLAQYPVAEFAPPEVIEDELRGLTETELAALASSEFAVVGAHTCDHPYLTACTPERMEEEVAGSKNTLERICGRPVTMFAYPSGDYNPQVADAVKRAGFNLAFAVNPHTRIPDAALSVPRAGIYWGGLGILATKSYGWHLS